MSELEALQLEVKELKSAINDIADIMRNYMKAQKDMADVNVIKQKWCNKTVAMSMLCCKQKKLTSLVNEGKILASNTGGKTHRLFNVESIEKYISDSSKVSLIKQ